VLTATLRAWTPGIIDGLVQVQDYAAALIATSPRVSDDTAVARLSARMERQRRVLGREKPPSVTNSRRHRGGGQQEQGGL
jgi:hypothetical protein